MTATHNPHDDIPSILNHLRRGATYCVRTSKSSTAGEYLGIESPHGDRAILLRHAAGTDSIPLHHVTSIENFAERVVRCAAQLLE